MKLTALNQVCFLAFLCLLPMWSWAAGNDETPSSSDDEMSDREMPFDGRPDDEISFGDLPEGEPFQHETPEGEMSDGGTSADEMSVDLLPPHDVPPLVGLPPSGDGLIPAILNPYVMDSDSDDNIASDDNDSPSAYSLFEDETAE
jgi:hypothetical protein